VVCGWGCFWGFIQLLDEKMKRKEAQMEKGTCISQTIALIRFIDGLTRGQPEGNKRTEGKIISAPVLRRRGRKGAKGRKGKTLPSLLSYFLRELDSLQAGGKQFRKKKALKVISAYSVEGQKRVAREEKSPKIVLQEINSN